MNTKLEQPVLLESVRTPIGSFGGSLSTIPASDLAALVLKEAAKRSSVDIADIEQVILGCVGQVAEDGYIARHAAIKAGLATGSTAYAKEMISLGFQFVTILSEFKSPKSIFKGGTAPAGN